MNRRIIAFASLLLASCAHPAMTAATAPSGHAAVGNWGVDLTMVDKTVKPGEDFFAYSNGNWLKTAVIPADRSYAGVNYELNKQNEDRLKTIMTELGQKPDGSLSPEERKLRDLFAAYTDQAGIETRGMAPAQADLAAIAAMTTKTQVAEAMSDPALQLDGPYGLYIDADDKNPTAYALRLYQSGIGLPDRDYYLRSDKEIVETRARLSQIPADDAGVRGRRECGSARECRARPRNPISRRRIGRPPTGATPTRPTIR